MSAIFKGHPLVEPEHARGVMEAEAAASRLVDGLVAGVASGCFVLIGLPALGDGTWRLVMVSLLPIAAAVYSIGLTYAFRARSWLSKYDQSAEE